MVFSQRTKSEKQQGKLNLEEAYNIWDLATAKYDIIDQLQTSLSYVHDPDLKTILSGVITRIGDNIRLLEVELKRFSIAGPMRPPKYFNTAVNSEIQTDGRIAKRLLLMCQGSIELLLRSIRTSTTNDHLRTLFTTFCSQTVDSLDIVIKYTKLKGWGDMPHLYPSVPVNTPETLDCGEAFHLWDHLTFRYDNINQTLYWYEYAHDGDFKLLLKQGLQGTLQKQSNLLENELKYFGIPLPQRPPATIHAVKESAVIDDQSMFRVLTIGVVGAAWLHALAVKQSLTNDRVRGIFKQLLLEEIKVLNLLIKFGKTKAWLNPVPNYAPIK